MRALLLLPVALAAIGAAGCGSASADPEQTAFQPPRRDLTLRQTESSAVEVASPVELARAPAQARAVRQVHHSRKAAPASRRPVPPVAAPAPAPVAAPVVPAAPVAAPARTEAPDPHALAPGQTVSIVPASTASTDAPSGGDWTDQLPAHGGRGTTIRGGGGNCGGRGHGGGRPDGGGGFRGLR
jgi:hypothetical protein